MRLVKTLGQLGTAVGRHQVVMEPAHYRGLLRPGGGRAGRAAAPEPPRFDPGYPASALVAVRDLAVYAAHVEREAGTAEVSA